MLLTDVLKNHAVEKATESAIYFEGKSVLYDAFYEQAKRIATSIQQQGFEKDTIIALMMDNSEQFPAAYYGVLMAGCIVMPINTKLAPPEVNYIVQHSNAVGVIVDSSLLSKIEENKNQFKFILQTNELRELSNDTSAYKELQANEDDVAVVLYTSGTTGKPKGVMLTHKNIFVTATIWAESMFLTSNDRLYICTPLFHSAGSHVFMNAAFLTGSTLIIEDGFSASKIMEQLSETKATFFFGVPAMFTLLLNNENLEEYDIPHLRLFGYGAAPMPFELIKKLKETFPNVKVQNFYGQTENSPAATSLGDEQALKKIGSVGLPLSNTEVRIADGEGNDLPQGYVGEIAMKGPQIMKGYLHNDEETSRVLRDGWLYSGDLGRLDEEGYLYIVDRKKDMIIRNGENIYPIEIEEVLFQIPEILEAAVVGIPHPIYGEVPKAYVSLKDGRSIEEQQIIDFCKQHLAEYKLPFEVEFIDELPRNASGKVLKHVLRA